MVADAMTSAERVETAIGLKRSDRTPIIPLLLPEPAAGLTGRSQAEVANDNTAAVDAVFEVFDEYGGWDSPYPSVYKPIQLQAMGNFPMKMRIPGRSLPDDVPFQLDESEVLKPDDYDRIAAEGFDTFFREDFLWRVTDLEPAEVPGEMQQLVRAAKRFNVECEQRGVNPFFSISTIHPFFALSLARSMVSFTQDLYFEPEPIERALRRMTDDAIATQIGIVKASGTNILQVPEERASAFFFPPKIFERFWWPYTKQIVEACWSEGIVTLFHLDTNWGKNLSYFTELPRGSAILELDGTTDLVAARRVLGDHLCLKGDVPAALLSVGKPEDVEDYCKRLISEVGRDGAFILSTGCSTPPTVKPENFRAMIETGKNYRPW